MNLTPIQVYKFWHTPSRRHHCGIFCSADGGRNWKEISQPNGPANFGFAIAADALAFGSTTGNVFFSDNRGESWANLGSYFPPIYSVRFA